MDLQSIKEKACLLAAKRGLTLYTKGHRMVGVSADGTLYLICGDRHTPANLWAKTLGVLLVDEVRLKAMSPAYCLRTPSGTYFGRTLIGVLYAWLLGYQTLFKEDS